MSTEVAGTIGKAVSSSGNVAVLARPFVKWVGGKTQLLSDFDKSFPEELRVGAIKTYIEPFVGGGSVFLHIAQRFTVDRIVISDNNADLICAYKTIRDQAAEVIQSLAELQRRYLALSEQRRSEFYYEARTSFNQNKKKSRVDPKFRIERTVQLIFINKTCFNGLYRVNGSGDFNVAFGKYENPKICDAENIERVSRVLSSSEILHCDFEDTFQFAKGNTFIYLDPPYRPISETANFTSYSPTTFHSLDQERLARYCQRANKLGCHLMISNSDPTNIDPSDRYFEATFPNFRIQKLAANRMVNCKAERRGKISELLITNY